MEYEKLKARFNKTFANIPLGLRGEIIYASPPMTYNVVWLEVEGDTEIARKVLPVLAQLGLI